MPFPEDNLCNLSVNQSCSIFPFLFPGSNLSFRKAAENLTGSELFEFGVSKTLGVTVSF